MKKLCILFVSWGTRQRHLVENYYYFGLSLGARHLYLPAYSSKLFRSLVKKKKDLSSVDNAAEISTFISQSNAQHTIFQNLSWFSISPVFW